METQVANCGCGIGWLTGGGLGSILSRTVRYSILSSQRFPSQKGVNRPCQLSQHKQPQAAADVSRIRTAVAEILERVRQEGDQAVRHYSRQFDNWDPPTFRVSQDEVKRASSSLSEPSKPISLSLRRRSGRFAQWPNAIACKTWSRNAARGDTGPTLHSGE